jgi:uncharacterized protein YuzE
MSKLKLELDREADAAYVVLEDEDVKNTRKLDQSRLLDIGADGAVVGIEFLNVSGGVDLTNLPRQRELRELLSEHEIKQLA